MQLIAYCVLVEENYGTRPPYGVIRYPEQQFEIPFTSERETELINVLADIQAKKRMLDVHRSHTSVKRCAACGYRQHCSERLDVQTPLL